MKQSEDQSRHLLVVGTSSKGKSSLLEAEAKRLGIPYEELLQRANPTSEKLERDRMRKEEERRMEEQRLMAVRVAFWENTPSDHNDRSTLHDALVIAEVLQDPTAEQVESFFMMLPPDIIGSALSWGLSDTEVRERTYAFAEENKQRILDALMTKHSQKHRS